MFLLLFKALFLFISDFQLPINYYLQNILICFSYSNILRDFLNNIDVQSGSVLEMYEKIVAGIEDLEFIEDKMIKFQRAWINDMGKIL